jgi:hypothetical protein
LVDLLVGSFFTFGVHTFDFSLQFAI